MATIPFSTWQELYQHLLTQYRNHQFGRSAATVAGDSITWASAADLREAIDHARTMAGFESGAAAGRTYAKDGGRG